MKFLEHHEINLEKWDNCIESSINGVVYPYSYYLDQVSPGWAAIIDGDYESVMPLPVKKKWGVRYIMQPIFVQQLGVFSSSPVSEDIVKSFLDHIPKEYRYIIYPLNTFNPLNNSEKFTTIKNSTYELDLISTYDQLYSNYSSNTKRNLQKSVKEKVFVTKNSNPDPIIESFRTHRGKGIRLLGAQEYNTLRHLIYSGLHRGNAIVYSSYDSNNNFCAGVVFVHSHKKSILLFSGSTPEAKKNGAMTAIIDTFIKENAGTNLILDFEGSNDANLARFYAGFGSKECVYLHILFNNLPSLIKLVLNRYLSFRKKFAGY